MEKLTKQYLYLWMSKNYSSNKIKEFLYQNNFHFDVFNTELVKLFYKFGAIVFDHLEIAINEFNSPEIQYNQIKNQLKKNYKKLLKQDITYNKNLYSCTQNIIKIFNNTNPNKKKSPARLYNSVISSVSNAFSKQFRLTIPTISETDEVDAINFDHNNQIFLSYSFSDKLYSFALFYYFYINGAFLFVDWMWYGENRNIKNLKSILHKHLSESKQFLFFRTTSSEITSTSKYHTIRQWCAWEIGQYYSINNEEKYLMDILNVKNNYPKNTLLNDFKDFINIVDGKLV